MPPPLLFSPPCLQVLPQLCPCYQVSREGWFSKTSSEKLHIILPNECKNFPTGACLHSWIGLPDLTNKRTGCPMTFEFQIINESLCSIGMPHLNSTVLFGIYLSWKVVCCLSEIPGSLGILYFTWQLSWGPRIPRRFLSQTNAGWTLCDDNERNTTRRYIAIAPSYLKVWTTGVQLCPVLRRVTFIFNRL